MWSGRSCAVQDGTSPHLNSPRPPRFRYIGIFCLVQSVRPYQATPSSLVIVSQSSDVRTFYVSTASIKPALVTLYNYHRLEVHNHAKRRLDLPIKIVHVQGTAKPIPTALISSTFTFAWGVWSRWAIKPSNQSQTKSGNLDGEQNHQTSTACYYIT